MKRYLIPLALLAVLMIWFLFKPDARVGENQIVSPTPAPASSNLKDHSVVMDSKDALEVRAQRTKPGDGAEKTEDYPSQRVMLPSSWIDGKVPNEINYSIRGLEKSTLWATPSATEYSSAFIASGSVSPDRENEIGYVSEEVPDTRAFLDSKLAGTADESLITSAQRRSSRFFEAVSGRNFAGNITRASDQREPYTFEIQFAASDRETDQMISQDMDAVANFDDETLVDMRRLNSSVGFWRFELSKSGIDLPNTTCPWAKGYDQDRKQFFYLAQSKQLVANVYCKKAKATSWTRVGTLGASLAQ